MKRGAQAFFFGSLFVLAVVGVILSATLYSTQWGLVLLLPYMLLPFTAAGSSAMGQNDENSRSTNFGAAFESFCWFSTVSLPCTLYGLDAIDHYQFGWLIASDALVFTSFIGLAWRHQRN